LLRTASPVLAGQQLVDVLNCVCPNLFLDESVRLLELSLDCMMLELGVLVQLFGLTILCAVVFTIP
jgi:hypothetical protein